MDQVYDAGLPAVGCEVKLKLKLKLKLNLKLKPNPAPSRTSLDPDLFVDRSRLPE